MRRCFQARGRCPHFLPLRKPSRGPHAGRPGASGRRNSDLIDRETEQLRANLARNSGVTAEVIEGDLEMQ